MPDSVQGIIAARLDGLPPEEKALLQDAAVVGKVFWPGALAVIGGADRWALEERLHLLERKDFLRRDRRSSVGGESEYAFRHVLVRDVAYGSIPRVRRAEKHRLAAEWIESLSAERAEDYAEMLAHHYSRALEFARLSGQESADLVERARLALRAAGDRAAALNAFVAAAGFYAAAFELWPVGGAERPRLLFDYGRAVYHADDKGELLAEARDALLAAGDRERAALADFYIGELRWRLGEGDPAFEQLERAVALIRTEPPSWTKAYMLATLCFFRALRHGYGEAIEVGREGFEIAEKLGLADVRAQALILVGGARFEAGDLAGLDDVERGLAVAIEANTPEMVVGYMNLAVFVYNLGDLRRAQALACQATLAAGGFDHWIRRIIPVNLILEHYRSARWDDSLALADDYLAAVENGAGQYDEVFVRILRSLLRLGRGELSGAIADAERALEAARITNDDATLVPALCHAGRVFAAGGRVGESGRLATEALGIWLRTGLIPSDWIVDLAWTFNALGHADELPRGRPECEDCDALARSGGRNRRKPARGRGRSLRRDGRRAGRGVRAASRSAAARGGGSPPRGLCAARSRARLLPGGCSDRLPSRSQQAARRVGRHILSRGVLPPLLHPGLTSAMSGIGSAVCPIWSTTSHYPC